MHILPIHKLFAGRGAWDAIERVHPAVWKLFWSLVVPMSPRREIIQYSMSSKPPKAAAATAPAPAPTRSRHAAAVPTRTRFAQTD